MEYNNQPMFTMPVTSVPGYDQYNNGMNNMWNNPFAYLIWIYAFRMFGWNNNGQDPNGADRAGQALQASQIDAVRETVGRILSDVQCGNNAGQRFLEQIAAEARANGVAITDVKGQLCDAKTAVLSQLTNMQWQNSQEIAQVINAINSCCCSTQNKIDTLGCGIEKQILQQTNQIQGQLASNQMNTQQGFNQIANGLSSLGYAMSQNDCNLRQLISAEGCATRQLMRDLHTEDILATKDATISSLQGKILEYSQAAQTATIINALKPATTTTTTTPAA